MIAFVGFKGADLMAFSMLFRALRELTVSFEILPDPAGQPASSDWPAPEILRSSAHAAATLREPYLELCAGFDPRRVDELEQSLARAGARVAVWCPGQISGLVGRAAAASLGLPLVCLLPPFFEFKALQPFSCPFDDRDEWFLAAGPLGAERFLRAGAPSDRVIQMGSPRFESFVESLARTTPRPSRDEVLVPLQSESGETEMIDIVRAWTDRNAGTSLVLRPHPALPGLDTAYRGLSSRIACGSLADVLAGAFAAVSRNSMVLLEAVLAGTAAVAWQDSDLPSEITFAGLGGLSSTSGAAELEDALSIARESYREDARIEHAKEARALVLPGSVRPARDIAAFLAKLC